MLKNEDKIVEWIDRFAEIPLAEIRNPDDADDTDDNDAFSNINTYHGNFSFVGGKKRNKKRKKEEHEGKTGNRQRRKKGEKGENSYFFPYHYNLKIVPLYPYLNFFNNPCPIATLVTINNNRKTGLFSWMPH